MNKHIKVILLGAFFMTTQSTAKNYQSVTDKIAAAGARLPLAPLSPEAKQLVIGGTYEHYSGNWYQVTAIARHSETLEEYVVYSQLANGETNDTTSNVWIRPLPMFVETVSISGQQVPRFKFVQR
jgi:hypothetical protein